MQIECPNCRAPIPRMRLFMTSLWGRWQCSACGAVLGINVRRRLLAMIPYLVLVILLVGVLRIPNYGLAVALPVIIGAGMLNFFYFDRPVVHERTGFRCRQCGYDLQGQKEGRCPECGAEFELEALETHKSGGPQSPRRVRTGWRIAALVFVSALTLLLIASLLFHIQSPGRRTLPLPASAPATGTPVTTPVTPATP